jgi:hypothetical protein
MIKQMKQKMIIAICCTVFIISNIFAQKTKSSYASVGLNTGVSSLGFKISGLDGVEGTANPKMGFGISARYNYYFNSHWGVGSGVGLSIYNSDAMLYGGMDDANRYLLGDYKDDDDSGLPQSFNLRARLENIREKQNIHFFEIPLTVLYQTRFSYGKWGAYGSFGIKFQMPVTTKYEAESNPESRLNVSGFYTDGTQGFEIGAPDMPPLPYHGFGTVDNPAKTLNWKNNNTELKQGIAGTFEAGALNRLNSESDFMIGVYVDYGFSDIKNSNGSLLSGPAGSYHPDANDNIGKGIIYNGLLNSNHTDKIKPVSFGIKIGLRFKL